VQAGSSGPVHSAPDSGLTIDAQNAISLDPAVPVVPACANGQLVHRGPAKFDCIDSTQFASAASVAQLQNAGYVTKATVDNSVASLQSQINALVPPGTLVAFAGNTTPAGWLLCDGSLVSRNTYAALFSAIGVAFGAGDAVNTFALPDMRGRFLRGVNGTATPPNDPDMDSRTASNTGGNIRNNVGSVQDDEFSSHTHPPTTTGGFIEGAPPGTFTVQSGANFAMIAQTATGVAGGKETRPKNVYVNFIIKQ
jgi:microcystin-dependent protein